MLEINLLPVREARRKAGIRQQLMQLLLALMVIGGAIGLVHSRLNEQIGSAQLRVREMQSDIEKFQPQLEQVAAFKKKKSELEKKIDIIDGLDKARSGPVRLLSELASRTPERLWLTSLGTKGNSISMKGQSLDNELVADFLGQLNASKYFDDVDLDSTEIQQSKSGGLKLMSFSIRAKLMHMGGSKGKADKKSKGRAKRRKKA
jgi:type IV pilus assembly protein PilN